LRGAARGNQMELFNELMKINPEEYKLYWNDLAENAIEICLIISIPLLQIIIL
jgi:hypothetical protein